jgi:hypothetical protein
VAKQQTTLRRPVNGATAVNNNETSKLHQTDFLHRQYQKNVQPYHQQQQ